MIADDNFVIKVVPDGDIGLVCEKFLNLTRKGPKPKVMPKYYKRHGGLSAREFHQRLMTSNRYNII